MRIGGGEIELDGDRAGEDAGDRRDNAAFERPEPGRRKVARDAENSRRVGAVGRQVDIDHRLVQPGPGGIGHADRRIVGQLHDAVRLVRQFQLRRRAQHAERFDAPDHPLAKRDLLARNVGSGRREHASEARAGIGRAADHLHRRAGPGIHHADAEAVGIGVRLGFDDMADDKILQRRRRIVDMLDFQPDAGERIDDSVERRLGVEVVFEPGEGEFHVGRFLNNRLIARTRRLSRDSAPIILTADSADLTRRKHSLSE